jgi:hypothetical protein
MPKKYAQPTSHQIPFLATLPIASLYMRQAMVSISEAKSCSGLLVATPCCWLSVQWAKQGRCQQPQGALVSIQIVFSANCSSFHSVSLAHSAGLVIRPNSETNNHARLLAPSAARKECRKASAQNLSQAKFHSQRPPSPKLQASNARDEWLYHH